MGMTSGQVAGLRRRWRTGDAKRDEIDQALDELERLTRANEAAQRRVKALIRPVREMRDAAEAGDEWLARNAPPAPKNAPDRSGRRRGDHLR